MANLMISKLVEDGWEGDNYGRRLKFLKKLFKPSYLQSNGFYRENSYFSDCISYYYKVETNKVNPGRECRLSKRSIANVKCENKNRFDIGMSC